jgi:hypothetical protein
MKKGTLNTKEFIDYDLNFQKFIVRIANKLNNKCEKDL